MLLVTCQIYKTMHRPTLFLKTGVDYFEIEHKACYFWGRRCSFPLKYFKQIWPIDSDLCHLHFTNFCYLCIDHKLIHNIIDYHITDSEVYPPKINYLVFADITPGLY